MTRWMFGNQITKVFFPIIFIGVVTLGLPTSVFAFDSEETTNITVYEKAAPAVVDITVQASDGPSSGTGVIIDRDGIVLTSSHVIEDAQTAQITLDNGQTYTARVLAQGTQKTDLALLKIQTSQPLPFVPLGDSSAVKVGQKVLAIGDPYGFNRTLTTGIVSRLDHVRNRIQTDASINPGNSGGPLLNTSGQIIGINQSIFNPEGRRTNIGIGFAVPVDTVKTFIRQVAAAPNNTHYVATNDFPKVYDPQSIPVLFKRFNFAR